MSVASHSQPKPRRMPQQERGERRVAELLDAAAGVIAESGYEGATMSAIAERAGAPIGSLYQFFPNKQSITQALRSEYGKQFQVMLVPLEAQSKTLHLEALVDRLIDLTIGFVESHPAFIALLDAPLSTRTPAAIRTVLRERVAALLRAIRPRLSHVTALRLAAVMLQIMKTLNQLYAEAPPGEKRAIVREFKVLLLCYLDARIGPRRS